MQAPYIGKAEYCFANSAAMLLASIGEHVTPEQIEVPAGVGLGAFLMPDTNKIFFSPLAIAPDVGLTKSLHILGFDFIERSFEQEEPPLDDLKKVLETSPALLGPLDMGYLSYQRHRTPPFGSDHYVLVYEIDEINVYLHDPYGYPYAFITLTQLKPAWKADSISYKLGPYHWWHSPKKTSSPLKEEIYEKTVAHFKYIYQESDKTAQQNKRVINEQAITIIADKLAKNELTDDEIGNLTGFSLPLAAKRAHDYAVFFKPSNSKLSEIKYQLAELAGHAHTLIMSGNKKKASDTLKQLAEKEFAFRKTLPF